MPGDKMDIFNLREGACNYSNVLFLLMIVL